MRFPKRVRGLALGGMLLVAGPVIAASVTDTSMAPVAAIAPPSPQHSLLQAQRAVKVVSRALMLRTHAPIPPRVVTPAPVHVYRAPAPVRHRAPVPSGPVDKNSVSGIILAAAARWGVDGQWMLSIARCESGLNPHAYNPHGPYYGLFQFLMSTFTHNGGTNIWDAADQANITAKMLAHGQAHQWSCA